MTVDYDLVIIGSSQVGIYAAKNAVQLQARVALVTQSATNYLPEDFLTRQSLREAASSNYHFAHNNPASTGANSTESKDKSSYTSLAEAGSWSQGIRSTIKAHNSLSTIAALGVDVIRGLGEFGHLPKLEFRVAGKRLRSRNFLLATGSKINPQILSNNSVDSYLTLQDLVQQNLAELPKRIVIIGSDPSALELAQTLARFKKQITLLIEQPRILPQEDLDVVMLIQAQLEAEGVKVLTNLQISPIKTIDQQKWLQAGELTLLADEIIVTDRRQPNIADLNLAGVQVKYDAQKVLVDRKLQTTNPRIYACGDLIGGYSLPNIAQAEADLILRNTLFLPGYKIDYGVLPWTILTEPSFAKVGLGEEVAKQHYGAELYVINQYFNGLVQAQISDRLTGMCKLVVQENGTIVGCSIVGDRAGELIATVTLMIKHKIKLDTNPMRGMTSSFISPVAPSMAEILHQASHQFYRQKLQRHPKLVDRLRTWFSLRRAWCK